MKIPFTSFLLFFALSIFAQATSKNRPYVGIYVTNGKEFGIQHIITLKRIRIKNAVGYKSYGDFNEQVSKYDRIENHYKERVNSFHGIWTKPYATRTLIKSHKISLAKGFYTKRAFTLSTMVYRKNKRNKKIGLLIGTGLHATIAKGRFVKTKDELEYTKDGSSENYYYEYRKETIEIEDKLITPIGISIELGTLFKITTTTQIALSGLGMIDFLPIKYPKPITDLTAIKLAFSTRL